jgi:hypothetical protein
LNLQGQVIGCVNIADQKTSVNLSDLTGGVYSIKITTRDGSVVKKLLKHKSDKAVIFEDIEHGGISDSHRPPRIGPGVGR